MSATSTTKNANVKPRLKGWVLPWAVALALFMSIAVSIGGDRAAADEPADFDSLRERWFRVLTGGADADLSVPEIADKATAVGAQAQAAWESLNTADERDYLWPDHLPSETNSNWINGSYRNVLAMAQGFATQGSGVYGDGELEADIVEALEWLHANAQQSVEETNNTWNLLIGIQIRMGDILTLMHESLTDEQIHRFVGVLDGYLTEITPLDYGANRSDKIMSKLLQMIAIEDGERMAYYRDQVSVLFEYVTIGDGMYVDGSFVQHVDVAYTGSYGEVLLRGVTNIAYLLDGSPWELPADERAVISDWVFDAFEPVIYRGRYMDMVRGRAIARPNSGQATAAMSSILRISQFADPVDAIRMQSLIKHWILANPDRNFIAGFDFDMIPLANAVMADSSIPADGDVPSHREMASMGRSVHKADGWALGVSMSSARTQNYELTNGENGKGWYTGDGMTYLYTDDNDQFAGDFWPTVDWYRLPGTTVDNLPRHFDHYQNGDGEGAPANTWAGGVTLGNYGASGMNLLPRVTELEANKSWFMFDDEVVALGSGIESETGRDIETIVEQRKLNADGSNAFTVDGEERVADLGTTDSLDGVEWAHLEGNVAGSDIGYYFPEPTQLEVQRATQSGSWYDINQNPAISQEVLSADFLTMRIEHGVNPTDERYGYVLLPKRTAAQVESYASSPDVEVLEHSEMVHAVRENSLNLTAVNFFSDQTASAADLVTVNRSASVMIEETSEYELNIGVADPTSENSGAILVEIDRSAAAVLDVDPSVAVLQLHPSIKFLTDVGGSAGATSLVSFDINPDLPRDSDATEIVYPDSDPDDSDGDRLTHAFHDFTSDAAFSRPARWESEDDPDTLSFVIETPETGNRLVHLYDGSSEGSASLVRQFDPQDEYVEIEFDWAEPLGASGSTMQVLGEGAVAVEVVSESGGLFIRGAGEAAPLVEVADPGAWYRIKLGVNIRTGVVDVWLDGELVQEEVSISSPGVADSVVFETGLAETLPLLVDNVVIPIYGGVAVVWERFDDVETGTHPEGWIIAEQPETAPVSVVEVPSSLNKSLLLDDNDTRFTNEAQRIFEPQTGQFTVEWKFMELNSGKWPSFIMGDGSSDAVLLQTNGLWLKLADQDGVMEDVARLGINTWHSVRLDVDVEAAELDLYLNGDRIREAVPFLTEVDAVENFRARTSYGAVESGLHLDDVLVHKVVPIITGVEDGETYGEPVVPVFRMGEGMLSHHGEAASAFESGMTLSEPGDYVLTVTMATGGLTQVSFTVAVPPAPSWDSGTIYDSGDEVSHDGAVYVALWWTRNEEPGVSATGAWQEQGDLVSDAGDQVRAWTPSWVYVGGETVGYDDQLWEAKWWTRNQVPGDPWGPWQNLGEY